MSSSGPRLHYGWVVLIMATLVVFGALGLARFGYTAVLPAMRVGLEMNNTQAGVLATANLEKMGCHLAPPLAFASAIHSCGIPQPNVSPTTRQSVHGSVSRDVPARGVDHAAQFD